MEKLAGQAWTRTGMKLAVALGGSIPLAEQNCRLIWDILRMLSPSRRSWRCWRNSNFVCRQHKEDNKLSTSRFIQILLAFLPKKLTLKFDFTNLWHRCGPDILSSHFLTDKHAGNVCYFSSLKQKGMWWKILGHLPQHQDSWKSVHQFPSSYMLKDIQHAEQS